MRSLLYLHGFLSSPQSFKAQQLSRWLELHHPSIEWLCPHLTPYPYQTRDQLAALIEPRLALGEIGVMGSSLGGFWATWVAETYGLKTVLINPSVAPWAFMPAFLDVDLKSYHTDDSYRLTATHIDQIKACARPISDPRHYWLLAQEGDETLDYRQAVALYQGAKQTIEPNGDHSFQGFERFFEPSLSFLFESIHAER